MAALVLEGSWPLVAESPVDRAHREDYDLAQAVARGDATAAERFVHRAAPMVRRVARAVLADRSEADDAVQVTLLEILHAAQSYRGTGSLDGWIRRIASRAVLRQSRKARSSRLHAVTTPEGAEPTTTMDTTTLDRLPRPLEYYLGSLPEVQREAVLLRHALGHTIGEISEITDAPIPTVRSRIKKGQQELRRLIQRDVNLGTAASGGAR